MSKTIEKKYTFSSDEQETILIYNRADDCWVCSTNVPMHMAKLEKQGWELTDDLGYEKGYKAPRNAVSFRSMASATAKRQMSDEERQKRSEKMKALRQIQLSQNSK